MDAWIARMERALQLLTDRLDEPPTLAELADAARVSPFHFHRIWRAMTGETVGQTVERLRISVARHRLAEAGATVTEAAMDGGFGTPQSFSRSFRRACGQSPREFLSKGGSNSLPPKTGMPLQVEMRDGVTLVALRQEGGAYRELNVLFWELWTWAERAGKLEGLQGLYGIPLDDPISVEEDKLRYDACLALADPGLPPDTFHNVELPGGEYAVLRHNGSYDHLEASNQMLIDRFLASGREPADLPIFHNFLDDPEEVPENELRTDILLLLSASESCQ